MLRHNDLKPSRHIFMAVANHQRKVPARKGGAFLLVCKQLFPIFIRRFQVSCICR